MIKIKKITRRGDKVVYETNNPDRPDFVYSADKFNNLHEVKVEITRSIDKEAQRKEKREKKLKKIKDDLEAE